jgi:hypothetical protein
MRLLRRRITVLAAATVMALAGTVTFTTSTASANPLFNSVVRTAFIWNCPTGVPSCSAEQTRVGDIRTGDGQITDVCRVDDNPKNLVYNRSNRTGAAKRTGFLYRENLSAPNRQTDSCTEDGVGTSAPDGTEQLLCPFLACGGVAEHNGDNRLRTFCYVDNDGTRFWLTTSFDPDTGGPLTAGFMDQDLMNSIPGGLPSCETLFT